MPPLLESPRSKSSLVARYGVALLLGIFLSSCALVPKPTSPNPITLTLNIAGVFHDRVEDALTIRSALTYWRRIYPDGTLGDRFAIGGANAFNRAINTTRFRKVRDEVLELDAGEYFLDSFEIEAPHSIALSQEGDYTQRDGWDHAKNAPRFLLLSLQEPRPESKQAQPPLPKFLIEVVQEQGGQRTRLLVCLADEESLPKQVRLGVGIQVDTAPIGLCEKVFGRRAIRGLERTLDFTLEHDVELGE